MSIDAFFQIWKEIELEINPVRVQIDLVNFLPISNNTRVREGSLTVNNLSIDKWGKLLNGYYRDLMKALDSAGKMPKNLTFELIAILETVLRDLGDLRERLIKSESFDKRNNRKIVYRSQNYIIDNQSFNQIDDNVPDSVFQIQSWGGDGSMDNAYQTDFQESFFSQFTPFLIKFDHFLSNLNDYIEFIISTFRNDNSFKTEQKKDILQSDEQERASAESIKPQKTETYYGFSYDKESLSYTEIDTISDKMWKLLKDEKLIDSRTKFSNFRNIFTAAKISEKVVWRGDLNQLKLFVDLVLNTDGYKGCKGKKWKTTVNCFCLLGNTPITSDQLRNTKDPLKEKRLPILQAVGFFTKF